MANNTPRTPEQRPPANPGVETPLRESQIPNRNDPGHRILDNPKIEPYTPRETNERPPRK